MEYTEHREKIIRYLQEKKETIQNEIWKELGIDSSKVSRVLKRLEKDGIIEREPIIKNGVKTFIIRYLGERETAKSTTISSNHRYYGEKYTPPPIKPAEEINPYPKRTKAHRIIEIIYGITNIVNAKSKTELAEMVGKSELWVYEVIRNARYRVNWLLASQYHPDKEEWVYFRAESKQDQYDYILRRALDHMTRGHAVSYLLTIADKLTEEDKEKVVAEAQRLSEVRQPFFELDGEM